MASVSRDEEQRWVPTHVQVLVIRARGLRAKGKHGTSDAYVVVQLGKAKYSTCVMEKTRAPEWGEECSFELQPGVLEDGSRDSLPTGTCDLTLTVMHRALIGLDVFLGQAVIALDTAFRERACMRNEWYRLHSKTGKKEKERGEIQLTVQFTRHNLTASMYDLSMKDKPRSAFIRLRERMRARKRCGDEESSSAIVPGGYGGQARIRGRLPSDGGGEEDYEDDEGGELRRSKMRSYFLHGRLRKSSDTRSSTSLGSESSESSSRGGSLSPTAGISVVVSDLSNSPSNSSNLTVDSPEHTVAPSPLVSPVRHVFSEVCDFSIPVPHSLTSDGDAPILLPSVCVNGNPVETSPLTHQPPSLVLQQPKPQMQPDLEQTITLLQTSSPERDTSTLTQTSQSQPSPAPQQPMGESNPKAEFQFPVVGLLQKGPALSLSMQNLSRHKEEQKGGGPLDGRRWSFDKPGEEEKAAIAAVLESKGLVVDEPVEKTTVTVTEAEVQGKKKRGLFSTGKEESAFSQPASEGKQRGWFSSKDSKPSPPKHNHDGPITNSSIPTPLLDLFVSGNQVDKAAQNVSKSTYSTSIPYKQCNTKSSSYLDWKDPLDGSQKLNLKTGLQMIFDSLPPLIKPTDPLTLPCTSVDSVTVTTFYPLEGEDNNMYWSTQKTDVNFDPHVSEFQFDMSLPHSSSIDFSDMNALACPYPVLLNTTFDKDRLNTVSVYRVFPSAKLQLPTSSEVPSLKYESLDLGKNDCQVECETVESLSTQKLINDNRMGCMEIHKNSTRIYEDSSSDGTLQSSPIKQNSKYVQKEMTSKQNNIKVGEEATDSKKPANEDKSCWDSSLSFGIGTDAFGLLIHPTSSDSLFQDEVGKKQHVAYSASSDGNDGSLAGESFLNENLDEIMTSSPGVSKMQFIMEKSNNSTPSPFKHSLKVHRSLSGDLKVETQQTGRMTLPFGFHPPHSANVTMKTEEALLNLNAALSPSCLVCHSLYASAISEHYLSCRSENSSLSLSLSRLTQESEPKCNTFEDQPKCGLFQGGLPTNYAPLHRMTEPQHDPNEFYVEALQKDKAVSTNDQSNKQTSPTFVPKCVTFGDTLDLEYTLTNQAKLKSNLFANKMLNSDLKQDKFSSSPQTMIARPEKPSPKICLEVNNISPTDPHMSHHVQLDCILEDITVTDICTHHSMVQAVGNSALAHSVPTCKNVEFLYDSTDTSQRSHKKLSTSVSVSSPQGSSLENSHCGASTVKPPSPCIMSHLTLATGQNHMMKRPLPLASSTPDIAVGTRGLPMSHLPIMLSASANSSPYIDQAAVHVSSRQPLFTTLPSSFPLAAHQVPMHLNSPHPVKPLTPPDEKRSEGRSVLEKLKSTINPGRGYHVDQEPEKKLLVEGGGYYYHLNHNDLVSLLLQRDAELKQEREEYDRRGFLLEKREVEIKKMKLVMRDLEDYIDTLLVRIMEQTPALLQVRSKLK